MEKHRLKGFLNLAALMAVTVIALTFAPKLVLADDGLPAGNGDAEQIPVFVTPADETPEPYGIYIPWSFNVYEDPDLKSKRIGAFGPETVQVLKTGDNGWVQIQTYTGAYWAYIEKNLYYIDKSVDLYTEIDGEKTSDTIPSQIVEIVDREGDWMQIETWLGLRWINPKIRLKSVQLDVPVFNQRELGYRSGCEIVSFGMMVNYKQPVPISELVDEMPLDYNPEKGYRGNVRVLEDGFTIFPPALMDMADEYLGEGYDMSGCSLEDLKDQLSAGAPIVVWVNGLGFNVHAVCLTGYNDIGFSYNDPWTGQKDFFIEYDRFFGIWDKPIYDDALGIYYSSRKALSYKSEN